VDCIAFAAHESEENAEHSRQRHEVEKLSTDRLAASRNQSGLGIYYA
jgi:hypothetical protein